MRIVLLALLLIPVLALVACGSESTATPVPAATAPPATTAAAPADTPTATSAAARVDTTAAEATAEPAAPAATPTREPARAPAAAPEPTVAPSPTPTATAEPPPEPTRGHTPTATPVLIIPTATPIPTPEPTAEPAPEPAPEPTTEPAPTIAPAPTPTATATPVSVTDAAFARLNEGRQRAGLGTLERAVEGDSAFVPFLEFAMGCNETVEQFEELNMPDIDAIGLAERTEGSECGLDVALYHIVPDSEKMRVEQEIWACFTESRDLQEPNDVSCAGRYTFFEKHVKWLPAEVHYTVVEGDAAKFSPYIPWIEEKLKVKVHQAQSPDSANLFLHLGVESPGLCPERYGCNVLEGTGEEQFATIYVSAPGEYFGQVLKHELLHALLPMGHLPEGDYLMSVRPDDPSQTQALTAREEKLLALYTNPYLRDGMRIERFRPYLIVE